MKRGNINIWDNKQSLRGVTMFACFVYIYIYIYIVNSIDLYFYYVIFKTFFVLLHMHVYFNNNHLVYIVNLHQHFPDEEQKQY